MPGLKFLKLDLHTHTPASKCYKDRTHTAAQIVQVAIENGLAAIAVTDHNSAAWIDAMRSASERTALTVFPGVEVSMAGFHLVALFDPACDQKHIENFLGSIDITSSDYGQQDAVCTKDPYTVFNKIHERGGLAILAHIDGPKGYFHETTDRSESGKVQVPVDCRKLFNEGRYDAVECINGRLPEGFDAAHHFMRFPAFYQSSDNPDPEDKKKHSLLGIGSRYSWFKMDQINLEGLRQCFSDPEVRIRMMDGYSESGYQRILSMRIGNAGFLRGQVFNFHSGLNSIIGGKGVGKSLAVEFLRFGLGQSCTDQTLLEDMTKKLEKRLELDTVVEVQYQTAVGTQYAVCRQFTGIDRLTKKATSKVACTNLTTGEAYTGDVPQMFPILAYSQTEVIKIAESKDAQLELLDRLIDTHRYEQTIQEIQQSLDKNDLSLGETITAVGHLNSCDQRIVTLTEQVQAINRLLANALFLRMKEVEQKQSKLSVSATSVMKLKDMIQKWSDDLEREPVSTLEASDMQDQDLSAAHAIVATAHDFLSTSLERMQQEIADFGIKFASLQSRWQPEFDAVKAVYVSLLQSLGGDQALQERRRRELQEEIDGIIAEANGYRSRVSCMEQLSSQRSCLLDQLESSAHRLYELRKSKYDEISTLSEGKLKVEISHASNRSAFADMLNNMLRGGASAPPPAERSKIAETMLPRRFVQLVLDRNNVQLAEESGLTPLWAGRVVEKLWATDELVELLALQHRTYPSDAPSIQFCTGGRHYAELSEISVGQKSTALLIIALCDGTMPVVIDQPEDALDIVSVWTDIAKKLRRNKHARQFILTTHNSSLAVAADSDQFIVMTATATAGRITASGAIDRDEVRQEVMTHLEGGNEPYDLRSRKYNRA